MGEVGTERGVVGRVGAKYSVDHGIVVKKISHHLKGMERSGKIRQPTFKGLRSDGDWAGDTIIGCMDC